MSSVGQVPPNVAPGSISQVRPLDRFFPHVQPLDRFCTAWIDLVLAPTQVGQDQLLSNEPPDIPAKVTHRPTLVPPSEEVSQGSIIIRPYDSPAYREFLKQTYVAYHQPPVSPFRFDPKEPLARSQSDIVSHCIMVLLEERRAHDFRLSRSNSQTRGNTCSGSNSNRGLRFSLHDNNRRSASTFSSSTSTHLTIPGSGGSRHLLTECYSFRKSSDSKASLRNHPGIKVTFPNSLVSHVNSHHWETLLERIGEAAMVWLLTRTSIFQRTSRSNWCQVVGYPVHHREILPMVPKPHRSKVWQNLPVPIDHSPNAGLTTANTLPMLPQQQPPLGRMDSGVSVATLGSIPQSPGGKLSTGSTRHDLAPSSLFFSRRSMFGRCPRYAGNGRPQIGLPTQHILTHCSSSSKCLKVNEATWSLFGRWSYPASPPTTPSLATSSRTTADSKAQDGWALVAESSRVLGVPNKGSVACNSNLPPALPKMSRMARRRQRLRVQAKLQASVNPIGGPRKQEEVEPALLRKLPWRLRRLRPLVRQILQRHRRCPYMIIFNRCCPRPDRKENLSRVKTPRSNITNTKANVKPIDPELHQGKQDKAKTMILEAIRSAKRKSLVEPKVKGFNPPVPPADCTPPSVNLLRLTTSHSQVSFFVLSIVKCLIPQALWGSQYNKRRIFKFLTQFLTAPRNDLFSVQDLIRELHITHFAWLIAPGHHQRGSSRGNAAQWKQQSILISFLWWLVEALVIPLVAGFFHVTASAETRQRLLYYRHDTWFSATRPGLQDLLHTMFRKLTPTELSSKLSRRQLPFATIRLMPKSKGVRLIMNLHHQLPSVADIVTITSESKSSPRATDSAQGQGRGGLEGTPRVLVSMVPPRSKLPVRRSINRQLVDSFAVCRFEKSRQKERFGAAVFGFQDVYRGLLAYRQQLAESPVNLVNTLRGSSSDKADSRPPNFYLVKMDIRRAYDTIAQDKLMTLLQTLISEDEYLLYKYKIVHQRWGKWTTRYFREGQTWDDYQPFIEYAAALVARHKLATSVLVDEVFYPSQYSNQVLELLEEHVRNHWICVDGELYHQTVGIPQGSVLSSLLCNLILGEMERQHILPHLSNQSLLMRFTDDYLLITTSRCEAVTFLSYMQKGFPEYGCTVNAEKTLTNFNTVGLHSMGRETGNSGTPGELAGYFPWCGFLIHQDTLQVRKDYRRYLGVPLRDTLTVPTRQRMGHFLRNKLCDLFRTATMDVLFRHTLLTSTTVLVNFYEMALHNALRFYTLLRELPDKHHKHYLPFILDTIANGIQFVVKLVYRLNRYCEEKPSTGLGGQPEPKPHASSHLPAVHGNRAPSLPHRYHPRRTLLQPLHCTWLAYQAFLWVFRHHQSGFTELVKLLTDLRNGLHIPPRRRRKMYQVIQKADMATFAQIPL
ncbi:hypothetical protein IWQ62_001168 [Dispira parvispora]|uniref:Telomerase reverse transcriptase n=1 Tax=Dispira parvispora TaxID=1520584 RepID=A0A9W8AWR5_9FUNG|nr:hypothetical protein IWQ62_001168 [Dispira parvispora]